MKTRDGHELASLLTDVGSVVETSRPQMSCDEVRDMIPLLVRRDVRSPVRDNALFHLASCPACRRELAEYMRISSAIKSHGDTLPGLPPSAWTNLRKAMDASRLRHEHTDAVLANRFFDALTAALLMGGVPPVLAGVCRDTFRMAVSTGTT